MGDVIAAFFEIFASIFQGIGELFSGGGPLDVSPGGGGADITPLLSLSDPGSGGVSPSGGCVDLSPQPSQAGHDPALLAGGYAPSPGASSPSGLVSDPHPLGRVDLASRRIASGSDDWSPERSKEVRTPRPWRMVGISEGIKISQREPIPDLSEEYTSDAFHCVQIPLHLQGKK